MPSRNLAQFSKTKVNSIENTQFGRSERLEFQPDTTSRQSSGVLVSAQDKQDVAGLIYRHVWQQGAAGER